VVATPGRLIDLIGRRMIDLRHVQYFVLDEVDRMLDMGFREDIAYIWAAIPSISQTMIFSATFPNEIQDLITEYVGQDYSHIK
jgi:superfamily II DNA/RNA helicase